ncbi:ubiquinol-cytochrome c reductase iron-sulfur subunit [Marinagarivorans algicola]|uniref:ubiquinol-cytochrome c reductase iron-sulfur subunit n=1 Tax=Marinagarivorans algicola TaxID=1513270 RepID=UPI0006B5B8EA|nr:ubiquinol-cytochrome c reductase iron-sulfur subunit [Marinagarivorans algicola]
MSDDGANLVRRRVLTAVTSAVGAVGAVGVAVPFVGSWNPSERAKAAGAPVEINISRIEPGQMVTFEWRGKPIYVVRRTQKVLDDLAKMEPLLRDPSSEKSVQPDYVDPKFRSQKDEFLVLLGLCTHLGCAPGYQPKVGSVQISGGEWLGGFFCKCHGSKFDLAGRVLQGVPAPINLEVPPHKYLSDSVILVGVDQEA